MILKRKIYDRLLQWKKESNGETAVLIDGARRVGKSYVCEQFAQNEYKSYILIDFGNVSNDILDLFTNDSSNLDLFFAKLSAYYSTSLHRRESLIIFDEVQQFPRARQLIKYLVADGRYDYLETGSLIRLKKNVQDIIIPSEEEHIEMFPMDFEEFLWAMGDEATVPLLRQCFESKTPLGQALHRKIMNDFRQYILVGGMPQAVLAYQKDKQFEDAERNGVFSNSTATMFPSLPPDTKKRFLLFLTVFLDNSQKRKRNILCPLFQNQLVSGIMRTLSCG